MQNSVAKKSSQQNFMSKSETVPQNPLSPVTHHVSFQGAARDGRLANVGRVRDKEGTRLPGSLYMLPTKEDRPLLVSCLSLLRLGKEHFGTVRLPLLTQGLGSPRLSLPRLSLPGSVTQTPQKHQALPVQRVHTSESDSR